MRNLIAIILPLLMASSAWAGAYTKGGGGGGSIASSDVTTPQFSLQNCGDNGCTEAPHLTWIPLDTSISGLGRDDDYSVGNAGSDTLKRECSTTPTGYLPAYPEGSVWTVASATKASITFNSPFDVYKSWCRDSAGATDDALCGTGSTTVYKVCSATGGTCASVSDITHTDAVACLRSDEMVRVVSAAQYEECATPSSRNLNLQYEETVQMSAGDSCQKLLQDGIHPTKYGALYYAQRWLDAYQPEVLKNNLLPWGYGETINGVAATTKWTANCGTGGSGCSVTATTYNPNDARYYNSNAHAGSGVRLTGGTIGPDAYLEYAEPADVYPGIYQLSCLVHHDVYYNSVVQIKIMGDVAEVPASDRADARQRNGVWETGVDWSAGDAGYSLRSWYRHAIGLVKVTDQKTLTIRIVDSGGAAVANRGLFVDECGLERAPIQSMDWDDQRRVPGGTYSLKAIGDSRMIVNQTATRFPWAVRYMQADPALSSRRSTPFRPDITFTNDVEADAHGVGGEKLADGVGPVAHDCASAPNPGILSAIKSADGVAAFHYDVNGLYGGATVAPNTANPGCRDYPEQVRYLDAMVQRQPKIKITTMFGPLPYAADVMSNQRCWNPDGVNRENCGIVFKRIITEMMHGQVGQ